MTDDTYNGWTNRETWAAALHLSNTQWIHTTALELVGDAVKGAKRAGIEDWPKIGAFRGGEELSRWVEWQRDEMTASPEARANVPRDVVAMILEVGSLWRVDWTAVAESYVDEIIEELELTA